MQPAEDFQQFVQHHRGGAPDTGFPDSITGSGEHSAISGPIVRIKRARIQERVQRDLQHAVHFDGVGVHRRQHRQPSNKGMDNVLARGDEKWGHLSQNLDTVCGDSQFFFGLSKCCISIRKI